MGEVVKFKTSFQGLKDQSEFMIGLAAGICDCHRNGGECAAETTLRESGLQLDDFEAAGVEEYDLDTLREMYRCI